MRFAADKVNLIEKAHFANIEGNTNYHLTMMKEGFRYYQIPAYENH